MRNNRRPPFAQQASGGSNSPSTQPKGWQQQQQLQQLQQQQQQQQQPQGNLWFNANFESGNIGAVTQLSECEYDIKIRPDTNNNRHRLWFYFSVSNVRPQQQRIPSSQVLYYRSPKGAGSRMAYVMSFLFQFDGVNDAPYYFAYAFPYTYTDLQRYLYRLERQQFPFLRREVLCRTLQQHRVEVLTITAPEGQPGARPLRDRKWVFMSARVHPGETPAQFTIHGVIDFLTGGSPRARALRGNVVFKIVPMLNPDGVVNGNYRCSYLGFDLNRHWLDPSAWAQPEILSVKTLVTKLHGDPSVDLDFYVDIHAHSVGTNSFMYGNNIPTPQKEWAVYGGTSSSSPATETTTPERTQSPPRQKRFQMDDGSPSPQSTPKATSTSTATPRQPCSAPVTATAVVTEYARDNERLPTSRHAPNRGGPGADNMPPGDAEEGDGGSGSSKTSGVSGGRGVGPGTDEDENSDPCQGILATFPRMLAVNAPDFSFARSRFDADPSKEGTGRRALGQLLSPDVLCFTLEVSFYASRRDDAGLVPYTRAGYVDLGRSLASTFYDYYGLADVTTGKNPYP